jgi:hypothetical protein
VSPLYPPYPRSIEARYGPVRRARFCYLYTAGGKRLTDLYQEAGRGILGWGAGSGGRALKNALSRGANGSFGNLAEEARLRKAVSALIPGTAVSGWYTGERAASLLGGAFQPGGPPWRLWRPWAAAPAESPAVFLPPLPLARDLVIGAGRDGADLPEESSLLPPPVLRALTRSLYDLASELPKRGEAGWSLYDGVILRFWKREGPYLFPKVPPRDYGDFAETCLERGLVISPSYGIPSIVPWQANPGDFSALAKL